MSRIFGYIGTEDCRKNLISSLEKWDMDTSGVALKAGDDLVAIKDVGSVSRISNSVMEIGVDCCIGIGEASLSVRSKASRLTSPPACNNMFAVAMDGCCDGYDMLKASTGNPFPIVTDEDLVLALLCIGGIENNTDLMLHVDDMINGNPTWAFFSANDDALFCKKGNAPLYVGVAKSGFYISSELELLCDISQRYFALKDGEYLKLTRDRAVVFDKKRKRLKKTPMPLPSFASDKRDYPISDEIFYCPLVVKSIIKSFVNGDKVDMNDLKIPRHTLERFSRIIITGTANDYYSSVFGAYNFGILTDIPAYSIPAGELQASPVVIDKNTLLIAVCDAGEDMPVINAIKRVKNMGAKSVIITSSPLSYGADLADIVVNSLGDFDSNNISLRGFISSYLVLSLMALYFGARTGVVSDLYLSVVLKMAESLSGKVTSSVKSSPQLELSSDMLKSAHRIICTGYLGDYALAMEGCSSLRNIGGISGASCRLDELESTYGRDLDGALVVAFISDNASISNQLYYLRRARSIGARILIFTVTNIEEELRDFDAIVSVNDSIPLLNPVPIMTSFYKTVILSSEENITPRAV